jgi:hypothetical protein
VQKLVLNGQIGEAIDLTLQLFPGILERNANLMFTLKVRQFIEMVVALNPLPKSGKSTNVQIKNDIVNNNCDVNSKSSENGHSIHSNEVEMGE